MGISPNIWGPSTWTFIHLIVLSEKEPFDTTRLRYYQELFKQLTYLLPCEKCRMHLTENIDKLPNIITLKSKRELFDWTTQLHNLVNKITNKQEWSLDMSYNHWSDISTGKKNLNNIECTSVYWKYTCIFLFIVLVFIVAMKLRK